MVFRCNVEVQTVVMFGCEQVWWLTIKEVQFLSLGQLNACVLLGQFLFHTGLKLKEITETYKRCQLFRINNVNDVISRSSCKKMNTIRGFSPHFLPSLSWRLPDLCPADPPWAASFFVRRQTAVAAHILLSLGSAGVPGASSASRKIRLNELPYIYSFTVSQCNWISFITTYTNYSSALKHWVYYFIFKTSLNLHKNNTSQHFLVHVSFSIPLLWLTWIPLKSSINIYMKF